MQRKIAAASIIVFIAVVLSAIGVFAGPMPDTGQTKCYDNMEEIPCEIPCPQPGEPFYGQDANYTTNPHSYTKLDANGNVLSDSATSWAMVRDNVTGLIWESKTDDNSIHDKDNTYNWQDAQDVFIANLNTNNFGGHNDWRLPTIKELLMLVDSNRDSPAIDPLYFPNTQSAYYWSSTNYIGIPGNAWIVHFSPGHMFEADKSFSGGYVRAVRSGDSGSFGNSFIDNGDGTVTDTNSRLMWEQSGLTATSWPGALSYCESLNLGGYSDWRLPDRNELLSLVDHTRYTPAIDITFFPDTQAFGYWSSTTVAVFPNSAWYVGFYGGYVLYGVNSYSFYVRAVRGGQCGLLGDLDGDTVCNDDDNCPDTYNPGQEDADGNGIGDVCEPQTIIKLSFFKAMPASGKIILTWSTESEIDNAGFNLYRAVSKDGEYQKINSFLIPAKGSATQGVLYELIDKGVKNRKMYWYKLEDIDLNGESTMHGPVSAIPRLIYGLVK